MNSGQVMGDMTPGMGGSSPPLRKYVTLLPRPCLLKPSRPACCGKPAHYEIRMVQVAHKVHPDLPTTMMWLYEGLLEPPLLEVTRNCPISVRWISDLPLIHLLQSSIDHTLPGAGYDVPDVRNVTHVHGGEQSAASDGGPQEWYTPGHSRTFHYPAVQPPTMLFFHDHAIGITRLNNFAGLNGGVFMIRDPAIDIPLRLPCGEFEVPLVIADKTFTASGQLNFYMPPSNPAVHPIWASHFLGDTILVNGVVWPFLEVRPCRYRLRIVNASDTRTYGLQLFNPVAGVAGPLFVQIGSDGGYLPAPVIVPNLLLAVAERADIIVDFTAVSPGTTFVLQNTANAPYAEGMPPDPANVGQIMQFKVVAFDDDRQARHGAAFRAATPCDLFRRLPLPPHPKRRQFLLQAFPFPNAAHPDALYINNLAYMAPVAEMPRLGDTEIWEFVNMTTGMHPMHVHLVQFQLRDRQSFDLAKYTVDYLALNGAAAGGAGIPHPLDVTPYLIGYPQSPAGTNEDGWKDTIQALGGPMGQALGTVTRIVVRFAPQTDGTDFPFDATRGQYVFHCHIVSHEDNDMMRPFQIMARHPAVSPCASMERRLGHGVRSLEADYVVVGSGAGGASLASTLVRKSSSTVVMLEAGANHDRDALIADGANANVLPVQYVNQYFWTNGQTTAQAAVDFNAFDYTGGRLLGGSTSINGMQYVRTSPALQQRWADLVQDDTWGPANAERVYTDFENYNGASTTARGRCGPVDIRQSPLTYPTTMAQKFVRGLSAISGLSSIVDYNNPATPMGPFTQWQLYQRDDGVRVSSATAFLEPLFSQFGKSCAKKKTCAWAPEEREEQFRLLTQAPALRILFESDKRATGVLALQDGEVVIIRARREVIVSAGVMTPALLLHSGVGPEEDLRRLGIPVVCHSPHVGQNLVNQTMITLSGTANPGDQGGVIPADLYTGGALLPDPTSGSPDRGIELIGMNPTPETFQVVVIPLQPRSRGSLTLASADPMQAPIVDIGYLSDPADLATLRAAVRQAAAAVAHMGDPHYSITVPDSATLQSDRTLSSFIRANLSQTHHWAGSCRMSHCPCQGVVDSSGRVFGARGLRVADASVLPIENDGNTSAPAFLVGLLIAAKILDRPH